MEKHTNGRRQILMALASLAGGLLLPGTGRAALQTQEAHHMLVVFYSHTGNTRAIARHIQALTGCDLLDLEPVTPYPRDYDTVVSEAKKEKQQGFLPPLKNPLDMVSRYDVILVGSPSWWGTFAGPVRTFLSTAALDGKTLVPFITHEGSGLGSAPADLRRLCLADTRRAGRARQPGGWRPPAGGILAAEDGTAVRPVRMPAGHPLLFRAPLPRKSGGQRADTGHSGKNRHAWTKKDAVLLKRKGGRMSPAALFVTVPCFWKKDA